MREVFVHTHEDGFMVVDKKTEVALGVVDRVILFNAKYKRLGKVRGWHGTLSEEFNEYVMNHIIALKTSARLLFIEDSYYPVNSLFTNIHIKEVGVIYLKAGEPSFSYRNQHKDQYHLERLTRPHRETTEVPF